MIKDRILIDIKPLKLSLKTTIRHASATRHEGESIWIRIEKNGKAGFGEGCPRSYVAGDDLESSITWAKERYSKGELDIHGLEELQQWVESNTAVIDKYPSAWCAIEMAFLDLFSREKNCSVETLLGIKNCKLGGRYTAVLGDDKKWTYTVLADKYLIRGLADYKIKLSGNLDRDREKIDILEELCRQHRAKDVRIRLDANNLWKDHPDEAIPYLQAIGPDRIFAIEEPVAARNVSDLNRISASTGLPIILDESLCTLDDLALFKNQPGAFIANIKVSRVGGILRAIKLISEIKKMNWPVIIGSHVGETSLLTRAAFIAASAAGNHLIAQEGAFGDYLIDREPVDPMLKFGREGRLDLRLPYFLKTVQGLKVIPPENWNRGFGLQCRMPLPRTSDESEVCTLEMPDKYKIHYRTWGAKTGEDAVLILHGGMSHSGWQAPLADHLRMLSPDMTVVASDRRGCGLNDHRGDFGSVHTVIEDVVHQIECLKRSFSRIHLAGWCQGAQYASVAAGKIEGALSSLILLTPGFFWNERFRSVLSITEKVIMNIIGEFKLKPEREHACIPVPMEAADFTLVDEWLDYIGNDELKTTLLTLNSVAIMSEIQELSCFAILQNRLPLLALMAENDRIVDNKEVRQFIGHLFESKNMNRMAYLSSGHAIQFEKPKDTAMEMIRFIQNVKNQQQISANVKDDLPLRSSMTAEK
jgi:L-alanine-DL-glutamate epimerase-like enolase superfamily enzyme/alpha-beta hydrolase superfamily lysophospholipase